MGSEVRGRGLGEERSGRFWWGFTRWFALPMKKIKGGEEGCQADEGRSRSRGKRLVNKSLLGLRRSDTLVCDKILSPLARCRIDKNEPGFKLRVRMSGRE